MNSKKQDNVKQLPEPTFLFPLVSFLVAVAILWGNVVANRGYGLACPDWPLCHGKLVPLMHMRIDVFIEYAHRLLAGTLTLIAVLTAVHVYRLYSSAYRKTITIALALLAVQIVLGGLTVILKLPPAITVVHLANSLMIFILFAYMTFSSYRRIQIFPAPPLIFAVPLAFVYTQSILGAVMRHTFSGMACPDFPTCQGSLIPADGSSTQVWIHFTHRTFGYLTFLVICVYSFIYRKKGMKKQSMALIYLVLFQIFLGVLSVMTRLSTIAVTLHLLNALMIILYLVYQTVAYEQTQKQTETLSYGTSNTFLA